VFCTGYEINFVMSKRKIETDELSRKRIATFQNKLITREKKKSLPSLPNELINKIFYYLPFKSKQNFKFLNRGYYNFYWNYMEKKKYLDPNQHIFLLRFNPPRFFEFNGVSDNYVIFKNNKRRKLKIKGNEIFCRIPTEEYMNVYVVDKKYKDIIGKSCCEGCLNFTYCSDHSYRYCFLRLCNIGGNHVHKLCRECKLHDNFIALFL
jgi:hypothetical protein